MAKYEDYLPGGEKSQTKPDGIDEELKDAESQQQARQDDSTSVDWEERYKNLEKLNSQQAQYLGQYKKMVDEYIVAGPTSAEEPSVEEEPQPITVDDLYDDPDKTVRRAVESHPAIREAQKLTESFRKRELEEAVASFSDRHPDYQEITASSEFADWVKGSPTRVELYERGNQYDLSAADALFSLYKAEKGISKIQSDQEQQRAIEAATLEDSSAAMVVDPPRYSRSEYVDKLMRAKQGDLDAETWVKRNASKYREALANGKVRD